MVRPKRVCRRIVVACVRRFCTFSRQIVAAVGLVLPPVQRGGLRIYSDLAVVEEQESALTKDVDLFNKLQKDLKESPAYK